MGMRAGAGAAAAGAGASVAGGLRVAALSCALVGTAVALLHVDAGAGAAGRRQRQRRVLTLGPCTFQLWEPCNLSPIAFYLFSSEAPDEPQLLHPTAPEPEPAAFDPNRTTHVVVHGYVGSVNFSATARIYQGRMLNVIRKHGGRPAALLRRGGSNVVVVDWSTLAAAPCYPAAVFNTLQAGRCTGELLLALLRRFPDMRSQRLHAVGFSLGAHVAAFASNAVRDATGRRFGRITGLDPALPLFATLKRPWKLDASDADFVDVLHTNVGVFGKIEAVGHADFYFNGGSVQPACADHNNVPLCSHILANHYFAESVESEAGFWGTSCPSYYQYILGWCPTTQHNLHQRVISGEPCDPVTRGVYFVETGSSSPFALG